MVAPGANGVHDREQLLLVDSVVPLSAGELAREVGHWLQAAAMVLLYDGAHSVVGGVRSHNEGLRCTSSDAD